MPAFQPDLNKNESLDPSSQSRESNLTSVKINAHCQGLKKEIRLEISIFRQELVEKRHHLLCTIA